MSIDKWKVPKGPGTHVLMDGGILFVPPEDTRDFYHECVQVIQSGTKLYVVEQKTEQFKFFVDLDYKAENKLTDEDLLQFVTIIHGALDVPKSRCLIARAHPRTVKEGIKSGVHIHWPDLVVTRTQAMNFRSKIVTALSEACPFSWDKVIDASVYGGSGLRMLWSHKMPSGDPYIPWRSLDGQEFSKTPHVDVLELFAVRTDEKPVEREALENTEPLEEYIQKYIPGQVRTHVKRVQRHEHDGWWVQTDSKYCEHIRKDHKSNHVWFHITHRKISQRCFDEDCAEFRGTEHILPPSIVEQLANVAVVGSPSTSFLMDIFPDGSRETIQEVRKTRSPVFGSGSSKLGEVSGKPPRVRTVGFDTSR